MKGNPEGPNGWIYTQIFSRNSNERYDAGSEISRQQQNTPAECCQKCGQDRADTKSIAFRHGDKKQCYCINEVNPDTCTSTGGQCKSDEWVSGLCTLVTNKKKRDVHEIHYDNKTNGIVSDIHSRKKEINLKYNEDIKLSSEKNSNLQLREKRSVDTSSVRQISCQGIWSDTAGQWSYDYEVPEYCFSKMSCCISNAIKNSFSGVNCTKEDLEALTNTYSDVELLDFVEDELWFEIIYK